MWERWRKLLRYNLFVVAVLYINNLFQKLLKSYTLDAKASWALMTEPVESMIGRWGVSTISRRTELGFARNSNYFYLEPCMETCQQATYPGQAKAVRNNSATTRKEYYHIISFKEYVIYYLY
jgi:predicted Zn-dependent protease